MEGLEEFMLTAEEGGQAITELGGDVSDLVKTTEKGFLDQAKKFMDIEGKEDEILERIKKKEEAKTKDPEVVKEDK